MQNGITLVMRMTNSRSSWYQPLIVIYLLLILVLAVAAPRIRAALRERITYPRSGYVVPRLSGWQRNLTALVLALLLTVTSMLAVRYAGRAGMDLARWFQLMPAVGGLAIGTVLMYVSVRQGLPRFLVVGVFSALLGVAVCIEYPPRLATEIWLAGVACALLCSGGITLSAYLRDALRGRDMNGRLRQIADLDRVIHEPARLMIAATSGIVPRLRGCIARGIV